MAGGSPEEGESRPGRREPTDADVEREWERITAGLSDLAQLDTRPGAENDPDESDPDDPAAGVPGTTATAPAPGDPETPRIFPAYGGRSPSTSDPGDLADFGRRPPSSARPQPPTLGDIPPGSASAGPRDYEMPDDEEDEGYIPPEPPPIGATDPLPTLAWLMALGGPILTVLLLIFWTTAPGWLYLSAVGASLAGWLVLFWRMPKGRSDSGDDNGAVL
ncbi:hypothetical protein [Ruania zhangjianzhongii]|uniref:hypothetical protein n=1 Tax=Ruania zhangjianzhongii TaxID=2603206 RepID=UPI0011C7E92A|nr:hypothetical protein [Ruania zhangjianzhongii]